MTSRSLFVVLIILFIRMTAVSGWAIEERSACVSSAALPDDAVWVRQMPWPEDDRQRYYHISSGTQLLPYNWFLALEQADSRERFIACGHMEKLHLIPDAKHPLYNPDGLPVGFAKTVFPNDPRGIKEYVGFTCAFCHTNELHVRTKDHRRLAVHIDGAGSMQNNAAFLADLGKALNRTAEDKDKLDRFAKTILREWSNERSMELVKEKLARMGKLFESKAQVVQGWGPGRFDALNRGSNAVFGQLGAGNQAAMEAPVSIPPLWNVAFYDWVQWSGSIQNPLARNIAQVIGIGAGLFADPETPDSPILSKRPPDPFASSLDMGGLLQVEEMVEEIKPPHWPQEVFGEIKKDLASEGKQLYRERCKHCHVPKIRESPTPFGQRFEMTMIPAEEVGTDLEYSQFAKRRITTGALEPDFESSSLPAVRAIELVTTKLMQRSLPDPGQNMWVPRSDFMARPHAGIWATPPFLHNGSVPNLYELLSPMEERTACFILGDLEYDVDNIGYTVRKCEDGDVAGGFVFDTKQIGNSNAGHEFRNDDHHGHVFTPEDCALLRRQGRSGVLGCQLSPGQRRALIEYLKTCDLDEVVWDPGDSPKVCEARRTFLPE